MKVVAVGILLLFVTSCEPIPSKAPSKGWSSASNLHKSKVTPIKDIGNNLQSIHNPQLSGTDLADYQRIVPTGAGCSGRRDFNITPYTPFAYTYVLDTLVLRWKIWNPTTKYSMEIGNIYDQQYATRLVNREAVMLCTSYFEENGAIPEYGSFFLVQFRRMNNEEAFCDGYTVTVKNEDLERRQEVIETLESIGEIHGKVRFLIEEGYHLDALSLIELYLLRVEDKKMVYEYWKIANQILIANYNARDAAR